MKYKIIAINKDDMHYGAGYAKDYPNEVVELIPDTDNDISNLLEASAYVKFYDGTLRFFHSVHLEEVRE